MSESYTRGPWIVDDRHPDTIRSESGTVIAIFDNGNKQANARLGACAPDLLAEVKEYRRTVAYYIDRDKATDDDEGARLKGIKLRLLDELIGQIEGRP